MFGYKWENFSFSSIFNSLRTAGKVGQLSVCNFAFQIKTVLVPLGEIDLEMLSELRKKHPEVTVDNEVVEPSCQQINNYKGTVFIGAHFSHMTQNEFLCSPKEGCELSSRNDNVVFLIVERH